MKRAHALTRRSLVGAALVGLGLASVLAGCDRFKAAKPVPFNATDITGVDFARKLALPDQNGTPRTLADWRGKVIVVFFGYTQCPDVCPTTMAELAQVKKSLGTDGDKVQVVFVSLDPERDTPEILKSYVSNFDPGFEALRGTPEQTAATAKEFKVFFQKVPGQAADSYTLDHTAASYIFDTHGNVRLYATYGEGVPALAADLKALLKAG